MIELKNISKSFVTSSGAVDALRNVTLTIRDGDIYGIIGMSGAGKSTLVRCINMLERPTTGDVLLDGRSLVSMTEKELREVRRKVTMIFQGFNLLMQRNCLQNIMLPLMLQKDYQKDKAKARAEELLNVVGLPDKAKAYPAQLSGGQQQRIAIARALATDPKVLLCDEATSALDPKTTHQILELIREINRRPGLTVIVITHQMSVVQEICNRVAILENGSVVEEGDVAQVFTEPRALATQTLVYPEMADGSASFGNDGEATQRIRLIFNGSEAASKPLLARMAIDCSVLASVQNASMRSVGGKMYGYMLIEIPGGPEEMSRAVSYLRKEPLVSVQTVARYPAAGEETDSALPGASAEQGGAL